MKTASWPTILLLAASLAVRGTFLATGPADLRAIDLDAYGSLARRWVDQGTYARAGGPTAFRPPLYPLLLALVARFQSGLGGEPFDPAGIALVHLLLGLGSVYLTLRLGKHLGLGRFAYAAAGFVAIDPLLLYHSGLVMTETLFTFLVVALLASLAAAVDARQGGDNAAAGRGPFTRLALAGVLFGLAALCRPTIWSFLPWVLLALGSSLRAPAPRRAGCKAVLISAGCMLFGVALTVAPWAVRNWRVLGSPVITTTHGGETFWRANNRWFYDACIRDGAPRWHDTTAWHRRRNEVTAGLDEVRADRACYREAWATIRARPADFARAVLYRWRALWRPWPSFDVYGNATAVAIGIFYSLQFLLAAIGLCRRSTWQWSWILLPLLLAGVTAVHALYWTDLRMRAPLMPALALLAAAGCQAIVQSISSRSAPGRRAH